MFVGKIFQLANTSIRYGSFFQFVEENKKSLDLDRVNTDLKRNGLDSSLCDFYILNCPKHGIIYKKEKTIKL